MKMPAMLFHMQVASHHITVSSPLLLKRVRLTDLRQYTQAAKAEGETRSYSLAHAAYPYTHAQHLRLQNVTQPHELDRTEGV